MGTLLLRAASLAFFFAAAVLAVLPREAGAGETPPLERTLRLDLWGAGFDDARREILRQTGVTILVYPPDIAVERNTDNLHLVTGRVTLRAVLECLAVRYAFRYRVSEAGDVELSRGYGWVGGEPVLAILRLDRLATPGTRPEALRTLLAECVKPLALLPGEYSLRVEGYPLPDNPDGLRATAILPPALASYLERAVRCLSGDAGDSARPAPPGAAVPAVRPPADWRAALSRNLRTPAGDDLRTLVRDLAGQSGLAFVLAGPPAAASARPRLAAGTTAGLGLLTAELARSHGLGRRMVLASGGMVFGPGADGELVLDDRSRELYWTGLSVAGFEAGAASRKEGGGPALVARLKREVYPAVWRDPACAAVFSPATGRLAVIAPHNVVAAVGMFLAGKTAAGNRN